MTDTDVSKRHLHPDAQRAWDDLNYVAGWIRGLAEMTSNPRFEEIADTQSDALEALRHPAVVMVVPNEP